MIAGSKLSVIVIGILKMMRYRVRCDGKDLSVKCDWPKKLSVTCDWEPPITPLSAERSLFLFFAKCFCLFLSFSVPNIPSHHIGPTVRGSKQEREREIHVPYSVRIRWTDCPSDSNWLTSLRYVLECWIGSTGWKEVSCKAVNICLQLTGF